MSAVEFNIRKPLTHNHNNNNSNHNFRINKSSQIMKNVTKCQSLVDENFHGKPVKHKNFSNSNPYRNNINNVQIPNAQMNFITPKRAENPHTMRYQDDQRTFITNNTSYCNYDDWVDNTVVNNYPIIKQKMDNLQEQSINTVFRNRRDNQNSVHPMTTLQSQETWPVKTTHEKRHKKGVSFCSYYILFKILKFIIRKIFVLAIILSSILSPPFLLTIPRNIAKTHLIHLEDTAYKPQNIDILSQIEIHQSITNESEPMLPNLISNQRKIRSSSGRIDANNYLQNEYMAKLLAKNGFKDLLNLQAIKINRTQRPGRAEHKKQKELYKYLMLHHKMCTYNGKRYWKSNLCHMLQQCNLSCQIEIFITIGIALVNLIFMWGIYCHFVHRQRINKFSPSSYANSFRKLFNYLSTSSYQRLSNQYESDHSSSVLSKIWHFYLILLSCYVLIAWMLFGIKILIPLTLETPIALNAKNYTAISNQFQSYNSINTNDGENFIFSYHDVIAFVKSYVHFLFLSLVILALTMFLKRSKGVFDEPEKAFSARCIRSNDGKSYTYRISGSLTIEDTAKHILSRYYIDFPYHDPYFVYDMHSTTSSMQKNHSPNNESEPPHSRVITVSERNGCNKIVGFSVAQQHGKSSASEIIAPSKRTVVNERPLKKMTNLNGHSQHQRGIECPTSQIVNAEPVRTNQRFYELEDHESKVKKRQCRLVLAIEEAFDVVQTMHDEESGCNYIKENNQMDKSGIDQPLITCITVEEAAQTIFPIMLKHLHKLLKLTRQQPFYNLKVILTHLTNCIKYDMGPYAFAKLFLDPVPQLHNERVAKLSLNATPKTVGTGKNDCDFSIHEWIIICSDNYINRNEDRNNDNQKNVGKMHSRIVDGTLFQLRRGNIKLLIELREIPIVCLQEHILNPHREKYYSKTDARDIV